MDGMKMKDQLARYENARNEILGRERVDENAGRRPNDTQPISVLRC